MIMMPKSLPANAKTGGGSNQVFKPLAGKIESIARALRAFGAESTIRSRVRNIGHLLAGNFGAAALSVGTVAIAAHALGVAQFGVLALVSSFVQAIERLVSFQSWQPIIRYGANLREAGKLGELKSLLKFALMLDFVAAAASWLIAVSIAVFGGRLFGWSEATVAAMAIYSSVLLLSITGTPTGVMRLAGRFREIAYFQVVTMGSRLALAAIALALDAGLIAFAAIWTATHLLGAMLLMGASLRELKNSRCLDFLSAPLNDISKKFPNIWRFSILANLSLTVRASSQQLDTLLVGALVDASGAGLYHIAKRVATFAQQAGLQVQTVIFPDIARLWAKGDFLAFRRDVMRTEAMLFGLCVVGAAMVALIAEPLIKIMAGDDFAPSARLLNMQIIAVVFILCGSVTRTALLCMGKETIAFALTIVSTIIFFASASMLLPKFGAIGANYAHIIEGAFLLAALLTAFHVGFRQATKSRATTPPSANPESAQAPVLGGDD